MDSIFSRINERLSDLELRFGALESLLEVGANSDQDPKPKRKKRRKKRRKRNPETGELEPVV